jgi:hypothetical protein
MSRRPMFKEKKSPVGIILITFVLIIAAVVGFVYSSNEFEKEKPKITFETNGFWNLKENISVNFSDNLGIKFYKISMIDGAKTTVLSTEILKEPKKNLSIKIAPPKLGMFSKQKNIKIVAEVTDSSKWNLLEGNKAVSDVDIQIDTKRPTANIIANSYAIRRGGSAAVIVQVEDDNLKDAYIEFSESMRFELTPFYKEGYFIALVAWPVTIEEFKRVYLIANDKAGNEKKVKIPYYIRKLKMKEDNINISDEFVENISTEVLEKSKMENIPMDIAKRFVYSNSDLRAKNVQTLRDIGLQSLSSEKIDNFSLYRFKRLKGSRTFANFADFRNYFYKGKKINTAWHLGVDWASIKNAPVRVSNGGVVIYNSYNGIYGNTVILNHGLGLASLYAHLSNSTVDVGDFVKRNQIIAQTGKSGAVFGDHLHFGILVQGVEVNPKEWMDYDWIKTRILDTISDAKKAIDAEAKYSAKN